MLLYGILYVCLFLRRLRHLNVAKNDVYSIPQLMLIEGRHVTLAPDSRASTCSKKSRNGRRSQKSRRSSRGSPDKGGQSQPQTVTITASQSASRADEKTQVTVSADNVTQTVGESSTKKESTKTTDDTGGVDQDGIYCECGGDMHCLMLAEL